MDDREIMNKINLERYSGLCTVQHAAWSDACIANKNGWRHV